MDLHCDTQPGLCFCGCLTVRLVQELLLGLLCSRVKKIWDSKLTWKCFYDPCDTKNIARCGAGDLPLVGQFQQQW